MASIFKRPGSDFWHIKFYDAANPLFDKNGRRVQARQSTGLRHTNPAETRKARVLEAERTLAERTDRHAGHLAGERWDAWVVPFIERRIAADQQWRYLAAWRNLRLWLAELKVNYPRQITYRLCDGYLPWRMKPEAKQGKYRCGRNTAIYEFKIFRWIMREAVKLGYATGNPAREVVLKRDEPREFANFTADDIQFILDAIQLTAEPERTQLRRAFLVARFHGVRLNETNVNPLRDVRIWAEESPGAQVLGPTLRGEITFLQKGKRVRTKPLHPELLPLFHTLQTAGAKETYPAPLPRWGNRWTRFFRKIGMPARMAERVKLGGQAAPSAVFHSLRVTVENLLRTAGVAKEVRMKYLTHEKKGDVNSGYDRIEIEEMRQCHAPLNRTWGTVISDQ